MHRTPKPPAGPRVGAEAAARRPAPRTVFDLAKALEAPVRGSEGPSPPPKARPARRRGRQGRGERGGEAAAPAAPAAAADAQPVSSAMKLYDQIEVKMKQELADRATVTDRVALCLDMLAEGFVESYVDFFYLTHRADQAGAAAPPGDADGERPQQQQQQQEPASPAAPAAPASPAAAKAAAVAKAAKAAAAAAAGPRNLPADDLGRVGALLTHAEQAAREGDAAGQARSYEALVEYFTAAGDHRTAVYFSEKCLDLAEGAGDARRQAEVNLALGLSYDRMGDTGTSIAFLEQHRDLVERLEDSEAHGRAHRHLVDVYSRHAAELERRGELDEAVRVHEKCLEAARAWGDRASAGPALYRIGMAHTRRGEPHRAIEYQKQYLDLCREMGDQEGEGRACAALASVCRQVGDVSVAVKYLRAHLDLATRNKQVREQVEASTALGGILSEQGRHTDAVRHFQTAFDLSKTLGDRQLVDAARVSLGTARGNMAMGGYMKVVDGDLGSLLQWKTRRVAFDATG